MSVTALTDRPQARRGKFTMLEYIARVPYHACGSHWYRTGLRRG